MAPFGQGVATPMPTYHFFLSALISRKLQKTIIFLGSQKFKYLWTPVINLDDFFLVVFR